MSVNVSLEIVGNSICQKIKIFYHSFYRAFPIGNVASHRYLESADSGYLLLFLHQCTFTISRLRVNIISQWHSLCIKGDNCTSWSTHGIVSFFNTLKETLSLYKLKKFTAKRMNILPESKHKTLTITRLSIRHGSGYIMAYVILF